MSYERYEAALDDLLARIGTTTAGGVWPPMTPTGQLALEYGTQAAESRAEAWCAQARDWLTSQPGLTFTADTITTKFGLPPGVTHNACGALLHHMAKEGLIRSEGWTVSSRAARRGAAIRRWRVVA